MKKDLISVIIPVYNRPKELQRAIKSVLNQTYQTFEILVIDDGSEENLKQVCDGFNDKRIRFLRNEKHTNANVARNRGIKEAKGEFIAMLDSDDEFLPIHLERRIEKIKKWGCDGIFGSAYIKKGKYNKLATSRPIYEQELMINYLLSDGFAPTPSHFYKANRAKKISWDEKLLRHQDFDYSIKFANSFYFKSDYKPTIIINWGISGKKLSNEQINSALNFILKHENKIEIKNRIKYYHYLYSSLKDSDYHKIKLILDKKINSHIKHISLTTYLSIYGTKSNYFKAIYLRLQFISKLLFS